MLVDPLGTTVGAELRLKLVSDIAVPPAVITVINPVVFPAGTLALILVEFTKVTVPDSMPLNATVVPPLIKLDPSMVIIVFVVVQEELKEVMVGAN